MPFQPNTNPDGTANPLAGKDDAILYGATIQDPGGLPLGTLEYITFNRFYNVAGSTFQATVHVKSGSGTLPAGTVALTVPAGWTVDPPQPIGPISDTAESTATFNITPSASAAVSNFKISALLSSGAATGYTDNVMRIVPAVEGRFHRWGKWGEYDSWLTNLAPAANRLLRSAAVQSMGIGETISLAGRRAQLVDRPPERERDADAAGRLHGRRHVQAVRAARAERRHDRQLHAHEHGHERFRAPRSTRRATRSSRGRSGSRPRSALRPRRPART